ncbi:GDP-mannose 4,6-dehydratase [Mycobacterium deserti]|uniref:GDP-mannose 4,6-dehydratase n=1 Tax=Mycobacterium deserti TaxID=2978347 RepID=A0ABT2MIT4_9MYCO|nr:GDP-mannose 4,6-dehydratase [Mycobacterium deserti]MCT7660886.1 GDP-mannose 4,6-dehydratase [Mycobacterium deserti]
MSGDGGTALVTGVTGQDGRYLAELLVDRDYQVHGVPSPRAGAVPAGVTPHTTDLLDSDAVAALVQKVQPDLVFHLAAVSSVAASWADPTSTARVNALSTATLLDSCLRVQDGSGRKITVVNASTCEIFAGAGDSPQTEATPVQPISPYGAAKAMGHMMCQVYRAKGLEATNAILYNHESPRRPERFVTRKITKAVAAIAAGRQDRLVLGDLSIKRDWGWAPDYVEAMYRMALHGKGDDFVVATGAAHSIAEFVEAAFAIAGVSQWRQYVESDDALLRPADRTVMVGDAAKASALLDWRPSLTFADIVEAMVVSDLEQERIS